MSSTITLPHDVPARQQRLWLVFALYIVLIAAGIFRHEMWADELHCWNIAKGSRSFSELIYNNRFEGHPPAWIALLWFVSKFTVQPEYMQLLQLFVAVSTAYVILFCSPFPKWTRILLPFGYYFLFEYGMISRNYELGVLFALLICTVINRDFRGKLVVYYLLLFFMSNVHLLSLLLAGSVHLYYLLSLKEKKERPVWILVHALVAFIIFLPAMGYLVAPSGSGSTVTILLHKISMSQVAITAQAPFRSFIPVPAWWKYHFWNTQFLMEFKDTFRLLKFVIPLLSFMIIAWACSLFRANKKSLLLFLANILANVLVGVVFSLHTERYSGYMFMGFVIALYLYCMEADLSVKQRKAVNLLLCIQMFAGIFAMSKDMLFPFSNAFKVKEIMAKLPVGARVVTDYRALNATVAYCDQPLYCIDMGHTLQFILWNSDISSRTLGR